MRFVFWNLFPEIYYEKKQLKRYYSLYSICVGLLKEGGGAHVQIYLISEIFCFNPAGKNKNTYFGTLGIKKY